MSWATRRTGRKEAIEKYIGTARFWQAYKVIFMSNPSIFIVDAFVGALGERRFKGNPAAVVLLDEARDAQWMQEVAAEMNLSETAFVVPKGDGLFDLRWFTPATEVKLCGHATLASAHVLWESGQLPSGTVAKFETLSGLLTATQEGEWIELDFPTQPTRFANAPRDLSAALGLGQHEPVVYSRAEDDWLLQVPTGAVETLKPNFPMLRHLSEQLGLRGIIVTSLAPSGELYDFVSRFFAPAVGIDEDPVTGSAHTKLAPYWGKQLGKTEMIGFQASQRGGVVRIQWRDERVGLGGKAATFVKGELVI